MQNHLLILVLFLLNAGTIARLKHFGVEEQMCHDLLALQHVHLSLHKDAYGNSNCRPKHHYCLHLPDQYLRDGMVLDTFTVERKHRSFKAIINNIDHNHVSTNFEQSVMSRAISHQLQCLNNSSGVFRVALLPHRRVKPTDCQCLAASLNVGRVEIAEKIEAFGLTLAVGHILKVHGQCGRVVSCLMADGTPTVQLEMYALQCKARVSEVWQKNGTLASLSLNEQFQVVQIWTFKSDGALMTLL